MDRFGNEICQLNGCADMLTAPVAGVVIPLVIIFTACQIFIYFFGLYCSLQLNFYYWKEYNLRIESRRKDNEDKANWKHRLELEKETVLDTVDSIASRFRGNANDQPNDPNHNENSNAEPYTDPAETDIGPKSEPDANQKPTHGPRPVIDDAPSETEELLKPVLKRQSTLEDTREPELKVSNVPPSKGDTYEP